MAGRNCFLRLCNRHCLALYLMVLGAAALWAGRSEVVVACLGALLTLLGYGTSPPGKKKPAAPRLCRVGLLAYAAGLCVWKEAAAWI